MATPLDNWRPPVPGRARVVRARRASPGSRALFALALLFFTITSGYMSLALLARVTPALFPGQTLQDVLPGPLPRAVVGAPGADSVFNRRINLLLLGLDARPDQSGNDTLPDEERYNARTDTIVVASVDPVTRTTNFLSFPRDLVIDLQPENGRAYKARINESFVQGLQDGGTVASGAEQVERDLKANFSIDIDYWAVLDFTGVEQLVDAVGGVDVDVPPELAIPRWLYSDDDQNARYITIPAGSQHLNGYMAVAFGRNRDPNDLARIKRQQLVMQAVIAKAFTQGILSPSTWPGMWDAYKGAVQTNVPTGRLPGYANLLRATAGHTNMFSLGDPVAGRATVWDGTLGAAAVLYWDPDNVRYWLARTFPRAIYAEATVEVRNALGPDGDTRTAAVGRFLEFDKALPTVYVGPQEPARADTEIVAYGDNRLELAQDIAQWLNVPESQVREAPRDSDLLPDVLLLVGQDLQVPKTAQVGATGASDSR